jgi:hypothetical protein
MRSCRPARSAIERSEAGLRDASQQPPSFWMFAVAGLAAGMTYWFVAGRYGGRDSEFRGEQA